MAAPHPTTSHPHYDRLIATARGLPPLRVAVVHPANAVSLEAALASAALGLIAPTLVGPRAKIEAAAHEIGIDLSGIAIVDAPHSHAAADAAVAMALRGEVDALMKGSLHTDELMGAVVRREGGLRTSRRISHCFVMDVPGHAQPLVISDAAINIAPTLEEKVDIVQNAIDLAHALLMPAVRVAILSATETVNAKVPSTLDAAVLCKMADRGQITGAQLDGPLAMDNAIDAEAALGLIAPTLVGPRAKIEAAAHEIGIDLSGIAIVDAPHSHAAADAAVAMALRGEVDALMKGSLHTDELMGAVVRREGGLRTSRRISHCFVMDVPGHAQPLVISDAAINIAPTLEEKVDIVQNAIDLAHALLMPAVRVAILSATETVNAKVPSTLDAAVLCKMADRGQITGAQLDGPLAMDNAIDAEAARIKGIVSPVAGRANVLIVPDLDAGNMLAKSLTFLGGAYAAGIVLGTKVPVILTSRADSEAARLASCAVASMLAKAGRDRLIKAVG